jgi:hypothetical protein
MPDTDRAATALAGIRERADKRLLGGASDAGIIGAIESAADVPRLLAAIEAALKRHQPHVRRQNWPPVCSYDNRRWPCPEVRDITAALAGTGTEGGEDE